MANHVAAELGFRPIIAAAFYLPQPLPAIDYRVQVKSAASPPSHFHSLLCSTSFATSPSPFPLTTTKATSAKTPTASSTTKQQQQQQKETSFWSPSSSSTMRPALPLLQLDSVALLPQRAPLLLPLKPPSPSSPNRPPTLPSSSKTTWRTVVVPGTAPKMDADMVGVALLAAEARRRGGIMIRERGSLGAKGRAASPLLRSRVRSLEKDVASVVRTMVRQRARARAHGRPRAPSAIPVARR